MAHKIRNPLAQSLGLVLQNMRDKMGGISSTQIASELGLAASHYRMIESGSAIIQPSRAVRIVQAFDTIEFVPLCQVLVSIQIIDSAKQSITDMRTISALVTEANPALSKVLDKFEDLWDILDSATTSQTATRIQEAGIVKELETFLTTEPVQLSADQIDNFMTPTYEHPISGLLYNKIGNILQGLAPFYLDTVMQLIDNLRNITPRVTPQELAKWEAAHKNRIKYILGIIRKPEIILDVEAFDYSFLWQESFRKMFVMYRDKPRKASNSVYDEITDCLKSKLESERVKYEKELSNFREIVSEKLTVKEGYNNTSQIDTLLTHNKTSMNNLWFYFMDNGYVVPFVDDASVSQTDSAVYGTSLAYDETCEKLLQIRELCGDVGFTF